MYVYLLELSRIFLRITFRNRFNGLVGLTRPTVSQPLTADALQRRLRARLVHNPRAAPAVTRTAWAAGTRRSLRDRRFARPTARARMVTHHAGRLTKIRYRPTISQNNRTRPYASAHIRGRQDVAKKIRGVAFEENLNNSMGLQFFNLSHRFGYQSPNWPYFEDVKIERIHYMAKSGVLSQRITTSMHNTTHIDAPAHVVQGTPFIDEVPLPHFFGSGIVVSIPKKKWEPITYEDLEKAAGKVVRPRDVVLVNTGWHHKYEDSEDYFCYSPGFVPSAGDWFVEKKVKVVGHDTQANDHPLATAIGPQRNGPLHPHLAEEYKKWSGGRDWKDDFPEWEPVHRKLFKNGILGIENVGGDLDKVTGKRCTFAFFPWNWDRGDGCIIRLVAILDPDGSYRIERGSKF